MSEGITITGQGIVRTKEITINGIVYQEQVILTKDFAWAHRIDEVSDFLVYEGYAEAGTLNSAALWAIRKISKNDTITSTTWADGNINYDNVWDDRATLDYS